MRDEATGVKTHDCDYCGCLLSARSGQHDDKVEGEPITLGSQVLPTYKCPSCGAYIY